MGLSLRQWTLALALLTCLAAAAYRGAAVNGYTLDAIYIVRDNPLAQADATLLEIASAPYWNEQQFPGRGLYRPLSILSFSLTRSLGADDSLLVDHLVNVGLQLGCALLVLLFLHRMRAGFWAALLLAGLFLVHPIQTEVVAGLVGRSDLLATLLALSALNLSLGSAERRPNARTLAALFLLFSLSLLAKESAATLFVAIPLCRAARTAWPTRHELAAFSRREAPLFLCLTTALALNVLLRLWVVGYVGVETTAELAPSGGWLAERWRALAFLTLYVQKLLWPSPLLPDYATGVVPQAGFGLHARAALGLGAVAGGLAWVALAFGRGRRLGLPRLGLLLFGIAILPVCNLVIPIGTQFGERLLHYPFPFALLMLVGLCATDDCARPESGLRLRRSAAAFAVLAIAVSVAGTAARVPDWRDNIALFSAAVRDAPGNYHSQMCYGTVLLEAGRAADRERAHAAYAAASEIDPTAYEPQAGLGKLALERGDLAAAEAHFERALRRAASDQRYEAGLNLAQVHRLAGASSRAEALLRTLVAQYPDRARAHRELGDHYSTQGRISEAEIQYELALEADRGDAELWQRLIWAHLHLGDREVAMRLSAESPPGTFSPAFAERLRREGIQLAGEGAR